MRDVVIIPQDVCPKFGGWIAKTVDAQIAEEQSLIEQDREHRLALASSEGDRFLAEQQRDQALSSLERTGWWLKWGWPMAALALILGATAGGIVGVVVGGR